MCIRDSGESAPITRAFPANPADISQVSRFVLGAGAWLADFPVVGASVMLVIEPQTPSSFAAGVGVQVSLGNGTSAYQSVAASKAADGTWSATLTVAQDTTTRIKLLPASGAEPKPYDWIDTSRYFTPTPATLVLYTTEGVYGVAATRATLFAEPPSRFALMQAAFGAAVAGAGRCV